MDRLKSDLRAIASPTRDLGNGSRDLTLGSRDIGAATQNDLTALVRTVSAELDVYVNARFTMVKITCYHGNNNFTAWQ